MNRCLIGICVLAVLLILTLCVTIAMEKIHRPIADLLEQAALAALKEDWKEAKDLSARAYGQWLRHHKFSAAVADHSPMDNIDEQFVQLSVFAAGRESVDFAATCVSVSKLVEAMADAHSVAWWSIL